MNSQDVAALRYNVDGLIPVIIQDAETHTVLTLAYANSEAIALTIERGETYLYSRSRQELWHKGATSGHTQAVIEVRTDCDADAVLYLVDAHGPACHTGAESCFFTVLSEASRDV